MTVSQWRTGSSCPMCGSRREVILLSQLPWPRFGHIDFAPFAPPPIDIFGCGHCGAGGTSSPLEGAVLDPLFDHEAYVSRPLPLHYVWPQGAKESISAPDHQVSLLSDGHGGLNSILDVGCFDGRLLRSFQRRFPAARLVGFDVSPRLATFFPVQSKICFVSGQLAILKGEFDLITLSHSLQYVADIPQLLQEVRRLLAPNGRLFLQVPDAKKKPSDLLLADCNHHFTAEGLQRGLALAGFAADFLEDAAFPRDVVLTARVVNCLSTPTASLDGFRTSIKRLFDVADEVKRLGEATAWHVLGTTIDASFLGNLLGKRNLGFVDEAPGTGGMTFQGLPVRHPSDLKVTDQTLLPLGLNAKGVLQRFEQSYKGRFVLV